MFTSSVFLRQEADTELLRMEMTPGEPTDDNRVGNFIKKLCECLNKAAETRQQRTEAEYKGEI